MPCTYTGGGSIGSVYEDRRHFQKEELDKRERMLCALVRRLIRDRQSETV